MIYGVARSYCVFVRNWWRMVDGELFPDPGARKTTIAKNCTEDQARAIAQEWNRMHKPGPLSRKAEYDEERRGR